MAVPGPNPSTLLAVGLRALNELAEGALEKTGPKFQGLLSQPLDEAPLPDGALVFRFGPVSHPDKLLCRMPADAQVPDGMIGCPSSGATMKAEFEMKLGPENVNDDMFSPLGSIWSTPSVMYATAPGLPEVVGMTVPLATVFQ
jgi:hypothetical protein